MDELEALLKIVDAYASHTGLAEATISTKFLGRGTRITELRSGGDMGTRTVRRAIEAFSENWPEGAAWPKGIDRPFRPSLSRDPSPQTAAIPLATEEEEVRAAE
jgi:hypothetical protein